MRSVLEPPQITPLIARFGKCSVCGRPVAGDKALYLADIRRVVCTTCQDVYVVLEEYDDGYSRSLHVIDVCGSREEALKIARELNAEHVKIRRYAGSQFKSYTAMPLADLVHMEPRSVELEEE
ncbi:hypothetical protein HRbin02_01739 [Candidatus Calditenuaceae archaeon HR02]|nr:hypothetical protein HRbin02_01739 [Candidatus Calditenuaceae archaeon HR02]